MSAPHPPDICRLRIPAHPRISPRGDQVVAVVQSVAPEGDRYQRHLARWLDGSRVPDVPLAPSGGLAHAPRYAPDGSRIAFRATHDQRSIAWTLPAAGYHPELLACPGDVRLLEWISGRELLAVVDAATPQAMADSPARVSWLRYKKEGNTSFTARATELWLLRTDGRNRLLHVPGGSVTSLAFAHGTAAYTVEPLAPDTVEQRVQVRVLDLTTGQDRLWWDCPAPVVGLAIAPDGERLAVVTVGAPGHGPDGPRLWILERPTEPEDPFPALAAAAEYSVQGDAHTPLQASLVHFAAPDTVLFAITEAGDVRLLLGHLPSQKLTAVSPPGASVSDFSPPVAGQVALCLESSRAPSEIFLTDLTEIGRDAELTPLPELNREWRANRIFASPEAISAVSDDGTQLAAQLFMPPASNTHSAVPMLVRIHGGPHLCYGSSFDLETQVEAGAGFAVLKPNLRGSSGLGSEFRSASVGEWGRRDYEDLMAIVDEACRRPDIDAHRLYLAGGSYGGYLTNWTITRTGRFRAAVSERSVSNLISKYGTADNGFSTNRAEMGGADLFDDTVLLLLERSPVRYAKAVSTPLLLIHGEADQRCPIEQSEQFFVALRRLGKDVTFVRFPGEGHGLPYKGNPANRIYRLSLILEWMNSR